MNRPATRPPGPLRGLALARCGVSLAAVFMCCGAMPVAQAQDKAGSAMASSDAAPQGSWNFVMKTPVGERKVSFKFAVDGSALKGTMTDDDGTSDIFNGSVEGTTLKWSAKVSKPMSMTLEFTGVINGNAISGGAKSMFGTAKFTGQRA